jgi:hypothetical protein
MKKLKISIASIIFAAFIGNAKAPDGEIKHVDDFTKMEVGGNISVILHQGDSNSVRVGGNKNFSGNVETKVKNGKLFIEGPPAKVYVTFKNLEEINISGIGSITAETPVTAGELNLKSSGTGKITMEVHAKKVHTEFSGAGKAVLSGTTDFLDIDISGVGKVDASNLKSKDCKATISGVGKCYVDVQDSLSANISGSGSVYYASEPAKVHKDITGIGKVKQGTSSSSDDGDDDMSEGINININGGDKSAGNDSTKHHKHLGGNIRPHWTSLEFGINGYNSKILPKGQEFLALQLQNSIAVNINFCQFHLPIVQKYVMIVSGFGLTYNNYRFANNTVLNPRSNPLTATYDTVNDRKSKLVASYLTLPILLEFNTSKHKRNNFHLDAGMVFGYNVGSHVKRVFSEGATVYIDKTFDTFDLNPYRYDATVRMGYRWLNLFANYSMSTLFKAGEAPAIHPLTVGISLLL